MNKYLSILLLLSASLTYGMEKVAFEAVRRQLKDVQAAMISDKEQIKASAIADLNSHNFNKREKLAYIQDKLEDAQKKFNQLDSDNLDCAADTSTLFRAAVRAATWAELMKETQVLPRRRTNRPTVIPGLESPQRQYIIPTNETTSSVNLTKSLPIDIFKGKQKKTLFDLDEGAPTIARTLSVGVIDVIHEYPLVFTMEETDEEIAIRRRKEIIEEYGAENIRLNLSNRDAIKNDPGYTTNHSYMVDYLDNRYAAKLVGLVKRDATWTNAEYYAAIEAQKEYLRSLLK
jgi:hypothetical protein